VDSKRGEAGYMGKNILLCAENLSKIYQMGEIEVVAMKNITFELIQGEFLVILGPSGSGKSTLLNILGGMDRPTEGKVFLGEEEITKYDEKQLTNYRRHKVGFVFQFYNLMSNLTAKENVELATELCRDALDVDQILAEVGLEDRAEHFPSQMSGGEQQRVAIARAVAKNPLLLLCDEPTGALDFETGIKILSLLKKINKQYNKTVAIITHNMPIGEMADRVFKMRSGEIVEIKKNANPVSPERIEW
jgi:putative ABC transport system ATP-binding protein